MVDDWKRVMWSEKSNFQPRFVDTTCKYGENRLNVRTSLHTNEVPDIDLFSKTILSVIELTFSPDDSNTMIETYLITLLSWPAQ
ncbi:hypothetical protein TNCV_1619391 [Trichonephila clavipes]|nr:hypothetical protein TNCV_1619391 [Trichonephila clavipes]